MSRWPGVTTVVNHQVYDAFGKLLSSTNPSTGEAPTVTCLFGYTGQPTDPGGTGLQNNLNRWYSAAAMAGRAKTRSGTTLGTRISYRYCGNSVTNTIDPSGMVWNWLKITWAGIKGVGQGVANLGIPSRTRHLRSQIRFRWRGSRHRRLVGPTARTYHRPTGPRA